MKAALLAVQRSAFLQMALWWFLCAGLAIGVGLWCEHPSPDPIAEVLP